MAIITYRPKRPPRKKRNQPPIANRIVTPPKLKPIKGPVIRLGADMRSDENTANTQRRSAIVEPKRKRISAFGDAPDLTEEELQRRGDGADALWRELVRRAAAARGYDER